MKNRNAILDTVVALLDQSEEIINRLETIQEKRPLTKREEEILKQEVIQHILILLQKLFFFLL